MGTIITKIEETFKEYCQPATEATNAVTVTITKTEHGNLIEANIFEKLLTQDEKQQWNEIKTKKDNYIEKVSTFSKYSISKLELVQARVGNKAYESLKECYDGFDPEETANEITDLNKIGKVVSDYIQKNQERLKVSGHNKRTRNTIVKFMSGLGIALVVVEILGSIYHPVYAAICLKYSRMTEVGVFFAAGASAFFAFGVAHISDTEMTRAQDYLPEIRANLGELKTKLKKVHSCRNVFTGAVSDKDRNSDRTIVQDGLGESITQLIKLSNACDEAQKIEVNSGW
jgi:hypothetical protein